MGILIIAAIAAGTLGFFAFFEQQIRSYKFDVVPIPDHVEARWSPSPLSGRRAIHPSRFEIVSVQ